MKKAFSFSLNTTLFTLILSFQIIFSFVFSFRYILTEENIYKIISDFDVKELVTKSDIPMNKLYEVTSALRMTESDTLNFLNSDSVKKYLASYISDNIESLKNYEGITDISTDDLKQMLVQAKSEDINISDETILLIDENKESLEKYLDMIPNKINESMTEETLQTIGFLLSANIFIIYIFVMCVLYLISCLFRWSIYKPLLNFGIIMSISSILIIASVLYSSNNISNTYKMYAELIQKNVIAFTSIHLFFAMLSLDGYFLIKKLRKS